MLRLIGCHYFSSRLQGWKFHTQRYEIHLSRQAPGAQKPEWRLRTVGDDNETTQHWTLHDVFFAWEPVLPVYSQSIYPYGTKWMKRNLRFQGTVCSQSSLYRGFNHMKCSFMQFCFIKRNQTRFKSSRKFTSWRKLAYSLIVARENVRSARAVHTSLLNCIFAFVREQQEWYTKTNTWINKNKAGKNTSRVSKEIKSSFFSVIVSNDLQFHLHRDFSKNWGEKNWL